MGEILMALSEGQLSQAIESAFQQAFANSSDPASGMRQCAQMISQAIMTQLRQAEVITEVVVDTVQTQGQGTGTGTAQVQVTGQAQTTVQVVTPAGAGAGQGFGSVFGTGQGQCQTQVQVTSQGNGRGRGTGRLQ